MALFFVVGINCGTDEQEIFECPLSWFSKENGTVCYPSGTKFNSWKGRTDKPPLSKGGNWITVPATLKGEFHDYCSAVGCAKRLEIMDTSEEETFRTNPRRINAFHKGRTGFTVEGMLTDRNIVSNVQFKPPEQTKLSGFNKKNSPMQLAIHEDVQLASTSELNSENYVYEEDQHIVLIENENQYTENCESGNETLIQNISTEALAEDIAATVTKAMFTEFAKINARLDKITEAISFLGISQKEPLKAPICDRNPSYLLPIDDEVQMEKLDNMLRNIENHNLFVEEMSRYAGKSGAMRGQKVALNIVDKWFKREFLVQCSWTGSMKTKIKPNASVASEPDISDDAYNDPDEKKMKKINFSSFKRVVEAFYCVVHLADSRYSKQEAEYFLKKQMRNANSRLKQLQSSEVKKVVKDPEQQQND